MSAPTCQRLSHTIACSLILACGLSPAAAFAEASQSDASSNSFSGASTGPSSQSSQGSQSQSSRSSGNDTNSSDGTESDKMEPGPFSLSSSLVFGSLLGITSFGLMMTQMRSLIPFVQRDVFRLYANHHRAELLQTAAMGGGPGVRDVGALFGLEPQHDEALGRVLRAAYPELSDALHGDDMGIDDDRMQDLLTIVLTAMLDERSLRDYAARRLDTELIIGGSPDAWVASMALAWRITGAFDAP